MWEQQAYAANMDAGFDAGEWSRPAHAKEEYRQQIKIAGKNRFIFDEIYSEIQRQSYEYLYDDGDMIGQMMGENR